MSAAQIVALSASVVAVGSFMLSAGLFFRRPGATMRLLAALSVFAVLAATPALATSGKIIKLKKPSSTTTDAVAEAPPAAWILVPLRPSFN